jgi:hypothetical protein
MSSVEFSLFEGMKASFFLAQYEFLISFISLSYGSFFQDRLFTPINLFIAKKITRYDFLLKAVSCRQEIKLLFFICLQKAQMM